MLLTLSVNIYRRRLKYTRDFKSTKKRNLNAADELRLRSHHMASKIKKQSLNANGLRVWSYMR